MKAWFATDAEGRVNSSTTVEEYAGDGFTEIEVDEGFDFSHQGDYKLIDGELVYDGAQTAAEEAAREEAEAEAERRATIDAGAAEFFADGRRERMQAEIDAAKDTAEEAKGAVADATSAAQTATEAAATAQTTADEAKTTADTAAASMNEYLDALLGLDATNETEATDAE